MWKNSSSIETPFWIAIRKSDWKQTEDICGKLKQLPDIDKEQYWNLTFLALKPLINASFDEVCHDLKNQLLYYLEYCKS